MKKVKNQQLDLLKLELVDKDNTFICASAFGSDAIKLNLFIKEGNVYKISNGTI